MDDESSLGLPGAGDERVDDSICMYTLAPTMYYSW